MAEREKPWNYEALIEEYIVCEQDNAANFQGYWTLAAIFFGISSAILAGFIYGVLSNEHIFKALYNHEEPKMTLIIGLIAIILALANLVILKKLKGWHLRLLFNQQMNLKRMNEIEITLGLNRWWRVPSADRYYECKGSKEQKVDHVIKRLAEYSSDYEKIQLKSNILKLIENLDFPRNFIFRKSQQKKTIYEPPSSRKHFPFILHTIMFLWVLIIASAVLIMTPVDNHWQYVFISIGIIAVWFLIVFWNKLLQCFENIRKKCKERSS
jgi:hypothetical protein